MAYQMRPPCNSYFVDSHEEHARAMREEMREREKHIKRQTQIAIGQDLSEQESQEYGSDILQHMENMEV